MKFLAALKQQLVGWFLHGRLFEWWLQRKMRRLEARYTAGLVAGSGGVPAPESPPPLKSGAPLRQILFISDIMWEGRELVPELAKIAGLQTLDLRPHLKSATGANSSETVARTIDDFIRSQSAYEPDAILFYARSSLLSDEAFELLRRRWSGPLLGMNLDDKIEFLDYDIFTGAGDDYGRWAKKFDLNLSNVRAVVDWYADRKLPVLYVPEGFHPKVIAPPASTADFRYELSFVGSRRTEREIFFRRLRDLGVLIEPFGFGWPNSEGGKNPEAVYRASKMNLGIGFAAPSQTLTTLKTRDFECPGAGACYLTTYNWELPLHYELGREILCYRSVEELIEIYSYYRKRPEECLTIAKAAWRRGQAEHTWEKRFRKVFNYAGFKV